MTFGGWREDEMGIHGTFEFADFTESWAFMVRVATLAEELDHHPDWSNSWNRVSITLISHDVGCVTERDRVMAERIDAILDAEFPRTAR